MPAASPDIDGFIAAIIQDTKNNQLKLPTLPEVAMQVRRAMEKDDIGANDIAKIIGTDPGVSARLLQVANSPLYRGNKSIDSVQMAVARLGNKVVRNLVISLVMKDLFDTKSPVLKNKMKQVWEHATEVAAISHVFAKRYTSLDPEQAMLAGLIHDIGALPVIARLENEEAINNDATAVDEIIDRLHCSVGKLVLSSWQFNPELIAVAGQHEQLDYNSTTTDYVDVVLVANLHSHINKQRVTDWQTVPAFKKLRLDPDKSLEAMEQARGDINSIKALLQT